MNDDDLRITEGWIADQGFTPTVVHRLWEKNVRTGLWLTVEVGTHYATLGVSGDTHIDLIYKANRGTLRKLADAFGITLGKP